MLDVPGIELPLAYPPEICVPTGIGANYARYECSDDYQSITKHFYDSNDVDCSGSETESAVTYTMDENIPAGEQGDFNCAGELNAIARDIYLFGCETSAGILWSATDVCYKYLNESDVKGNLGNYDVPAENYYQLSQISYCDECGTSLVTFMGDGCLPRDKPLSAYSANASLECDFFLKFEGFELYGDVLDCIRDGEYILNTTACGVEMPTTTSDDGDG
eukprot:UN02901